MKPVNFDVEEEQKKLVLERFKTLNPDSKISLGGGGEVTVKEMMEHVVKDDDFGKKVVKVQMNMIRVLTGGVQ
jgi:hypothetical protein